MVLSIIPNKSLYIIQKTVPFSRSLNLLKGLNHSSVLLIFEMRDMIEVLYDDELPFVLVVHEVAVKSRPHAVRHMLIYAIVKAV